MTYIRNRTYSEARVSINNALDRLMMQRKLREQALKTVSVARLFSFNATEKIDIFKSVGYRQSTLID